jgi:hypothetical protein
MMTTHRFDLHRHGWGWTTGMQEGPFFDMLMRPGSKIHLPSWTYSQQTLYSCKRGDLALAGTDTNGIDVVENCKATTRRQLP